MAGKAVPTHDMTLPSLDLLLRAINDPASLEGLSPVQWDMLIRQGRHADLLARIGASAAFHNCADVIPAQPRMHVQSALNLATRQQQELRWEVDEIAQALRPTGVSFALLKGAAYVVSGLKAAQGRLVSDVDILVPHADLARIEAALMMGGWVSAAKSDYDQRYYRQWMHELPPMHHMRRGTVIDVHHAILPTTARLHPSSHKLLESAIPLATGSLIKTLSPADMVLHSATHLFHEGDLEQGLRGLIDLDALLKELGAAPSFWQSLVPRAVELNLVIPLFYALRYASLMLATPIPAPVMEGAWKASAVGAIKLQLMDALYLRALRPPHPSTSDRWTPLARGLLYLRGHWLRMPPWLLTVHLMRKMTMPRPKDVEPK